MVVLMHYSNDSGLTTQIGLFESKCKARSAMLSDEMKTYYGTPFHIDIDKYPKTFYFIDVDIDELNVIKHKYIKI